MTSSIPKGQTFGASTEIKSGDTLKGQLADGDKLILSIPEGKTPSSSVDWALDTDPKIENLKVGEDYMFVTPASVQHNSSNADIDYQKIFEVIVAKNFQKNTLYTITATDHDTKEVLAKFTFRTPNSNEPFIGAVEADLINCTWTAATQVNDDIPNLGTINVKDEAATSGANGMKLVAANLPDGKSASEVVNYKLTANGLSSEQLSYDKTNGITLTKEGAAIVLASSGITLNIAAEDKTTSEAYAKATITLKKYTEPTPPPTPGDVKITASKGQWMNACTWETDTTGTTLGTITLQQSATQGGFWGVLLTTEGLPEGKVVDGKNIKYVFSDTSSIQLADHIMYDYQDPADSIGLGVNKEYISIIQSSDNPIKVKIEVQDVQSNQVYGSAFINFMKYSG